MEAQRKKITSLETAVEELQHELFQASGPDSKLSGKAYWRQLRDEYRESLLRLLCGSWDAIRSKGAYTPTELAGKDLYLNVVFSKEVKASRIEVLSVGADRLVKRTSTRISGSSFEGTGHLIGAIPELATGKINYSKGRFMEGRITRSQTNRFDYLLTSIVPYIMPEMRPVTAVEHNGQRALWVHYPISQIVDSVKKK